MSSLSTIAILIVTIGGFALALFMSIYILYSMIDLITTLMTGKNRNLAGKYAAKFTFKRTRRMINRIKK